MHIGRHQRVLPASVMTPQERERSALARRLDREERLKQAHAAEVDALRAQLARQAQDHRHDSLVIIASERADEARLSPEQKRRFVDRILTEDRKWSPPADVHGTRPAFPLRETMSRLLDELAKETNGEQGVVDARKLSPQEYAEHLRKRGLHNPALGYHCPV